MSMRFKNVLSMPKSKNFSKSFFVCALASAATLACNENYSFYLHSFSVETPFELKSNSGQVFLVTDDGSVPPPPAPPAPPSAPVPTPGHQSSKLDLQGDLSLCQSEGSLTPDQIQHKTDLKRRLQDIESRLTSSGSKSLYAGERNTLHETPACEAFFDLTDPIADVLFPQAPVPSPQPIPAPGGPSTRVTGVNVSGDDPAHFILNFSNGQQADFNLGVPSKSLRSFPHELSIAASTTGQNVGLHFESLKYNTHDDESRSEQSCTYTRTKTVCVDHVCHEVSVSEPGRQTVVNTTHYVNDTYQVDFLSPRNGQKLASSEVEIEKTYTTSDTGICYPSPY